MKSAPIFKYHGLGNDFVVVRAADMPEAVDVGAPEWAARICDRHRGVGADGVLVLSEPGSSGAARPGDADVRMVIYNRDGSRPEMCGNGVRCVVRHLVQVEGVSPDSVAVLSDAGLRHCQVEDAKEGTWQVRVEMGRATIEAQPVQVQVGQFDADLMAVDIGNPHAIVFEAASVETIDEVGQALNADHPGFPEGVNVEFVERIGPNHLRVDVFERGVGRTMACGTGACAAAAAAVETGVCEAGKPVAVELPGGTLRIELADQKIWMTGPVEYVFCGELTADWLATRTSASGSSRRR